MLALHIAIVVFMTAIGSLGAISFKRTTMAANKFIKYFKTKWLYIGIALYVTASLFNFYMLTKIPYSVMLPLTSVTYIWTVIFSKVFYKEIINWQKIVAIGLIIAGAILIATA